MKSAAEMVKVEKCQDATVESHEHYALAVSWQRPLKSTKVYKESSLNKKRQEWPLGHLKSNTGNGLLWGITLGYNASPQPRWQWSQKSPLPHPRSCLPPSAGVAAARGEVKAIGQEAGALEMVLGEQEELGQIL